MKNIERRSVQKALAKVLSHDKGDYSELYKLDMPKRLSPEDKYIWFNKEYKVTLSITEYELLEKIKLHGGITMGDSHVKMLNDLGLLKGFCKQELIADVLESCEIDE